MIFIVVQDSSPRRRNSTTNHKTGQKTNTTNLQQSAQVNTVTFCQPYPLYRPLIGRPIFLRVFKGVKNILSFSFKQNVLPKINNRVKLSRI